jgi:hypothetical protein
MMSSATQRYEIHLQSGQGGCSLSKPPSEARRLRRARVPSAAPNMYSTDVSIDSEYVRSIWSDCGVGDRKGRRPLGGV